MEKTKEHTSFIAWYINEDGVPYKYFRSAQEKDYPNDDHTAYRTENEAWAATEDDDRALLNKALNFAVTNGVITDSEADHLETRFLHS